MVTSATIVGLVFLLTGVGLLVLLREPLQQSEKPGSRWFALTVAGIALWPISLGASYLTSDLGLTIMAWNGRAVAAAIICVSWLLLAVEYTTRKRPANLLIGALGCYLLADIAITWTNPAHHLVLAEATSQVGTVLVPEYGPWFWARTIVNYGLILLATALFVAEWRSSRDLQRRQAAILTAAVVPPLVANLVTIIDAVPSIYDLTPFGLAGSGVLLTWALYRVEFLDVVPVARETAMEEMQDAVVTLDAENRVVDCNASARTLFSPGESYAGRPASEFFERVPERILERFSDVENLETEISVTTPEGERHFSVSVSPVSANEAVAGRVVVMRDVTPLVTRERALEERQQELDLLRQVLTRVLRHNLRNALTTIHGNAESLAADNDGETAVRARRILDASDGLMEISDKAGHVERIAADDAVLTYDLCAIVDDVVTDCRHRFPAVTFDVTVPDEVTVEAGRGLEVAVEALIENAAEYGDPDAPVVAVTVERDAPRLIVRDNGPGIPALEVAVLDANQETPLEHGSGIGLWLAKWVADHSGANLDFESDGGGTTVTIDFGVDGSAVSHTADGDPFGTTD